jgi:hypothetical protein
MDRFSLAVYPIVDILNLSTRGSEDGNDKGTRDDDDWDLRDARSGSG